MISRNWAQFKLFAFFTDAPDVAFQRSKHHKCSRKKAVWLYTMVPLVSLLAYELVLLLTRLHLSQIWTNHMDEPFPDTVFFDSLLQPVSALSCSARNSFSKNCLRKRGSMWLFWKFEFTDKLKLLENYSSCWWIVQIVIQIIVGEIYV